jgi:hypothetical protein
MRLRSGCCSLLERPFEFYRMNLKKRLRNGEGRVKLVSPIEFLRRRESLLAEIAYYFLVMANWGFRCNFVAFNSCYLLPARPAPLGAPPLAIEAISRLKANQRLLSSGGSVPSNCAVTYAEH